MITSMTEMGYVQWVITEIGYVTISDIKVGVVMERIYNSRRLIFEITVVFRKSRVTNFP